MANKDARVDELLRDGRTLIKFANIPPHRMHTKAHDHYMKIKGATTVKDARSQGATKWDLQKWYEAGSLTFIGGGTLSGEVT
eukprot:9401490-Karenia_brevis.AAC.1